MLTDNKHPDRVDCITELDKVCPWDPENMACPAEYFDDLGDWKYWTFEEWVYYFNSFVQSFYSVVHRDRFTARGTFAYPDPERPWRLESWRHAYQERHRK